MNQQPFSVDSSQINLLKNLDDIDDIFNGLAQEDGQQLDQDFEDFLECFSEENDSDEDSNYRPFPSFRNVSPSFQFSTFADTDVNNKKQSEEHLIAPSGDNYYPAFDEQNQDDSVDEDDDLSDFFDSFGIQICKVDIHNNGQNNKDDDVNYIEIKYFDETYKIPIFTAKLFEPEQPLEDRLLFENTELVLGKTEMHDFHHHLEKILVQDQKNFNDFTFSAMILKMQSVQFAELCQNFIHMKEIQQKWLEATPSFICQTKVNQFCLQMKQFQESVNFVIDSNSNKITSRRFFDKQKPAYFQDKKKENNKKKEQTEDEKILELQQIPYNQNINPQSGLVCILYFKAFALYESFHQFIHYKKNTEKFKEVFLGINQIAKRLHKLRDAFKILRKYLSTSLKYTVRQKQLAKPINAMDQVEKYWANYSKFSTMNTIGLVKVLVQNSAIETRGKTYKMKKQHQVFTQKKEKYLSYQFLQYNQQNF